MSPDTAVFRDEPLSAGQLLAHDLRALRKARGLTLAEIGARLKRSVGWLSQVERGMSVPSLADLRAFAELFGVPLSLFFGHETDTEEERGVVVRSGRRRSLGTSESGLVEELLSPDLGGSFEMLRSVFAPGAGLAETALRKTEEAGYVVVRALRHRDRRRLAPARRGRQFPLRGQAVPLEEPGQGTGGGDLGHFATGLLSQMTTIRRNCLSDIPSSARVVIIGGGAVGVSSLYHLAKAGWTDCVLLEKNELTVRLDLACGRQRADLLVFLVADEHAALFDLALSRAGRSGRLPDELPRHRLAAARPLHGTHAGIPARQGHGPLPGHGPRRRRPGRDQGALSVHRDARSEGALYDPNDGDIDPAQLTQALAKGARDMGAKILRFCPVTGARRENDEWIVATPQGEIRCEYVVNAAGYRAQEVGDCSGARCR